MDARKFQIDEMDSNRKTHQTNNTKQIYSKRIQNYNFEPETEPEYEKTFDQFLQMDGSQIKHDGVSESQDDNSYVIEPFKAQINIPKYTCKNYDNMNMSLSSQSNSSSHKIIEDKNVGSRHIHNKENFDYNQIQIQIQKLQNQPQLQNNSYNQNTTINPLSSSIWTQRNETFNKTIDQTFATEKHFDVSLVIKEVCQDTELLPKSPKKAQLKEDEILQDLVMNRIVNSPKARDSFDRILPDVMYQEQKHREELEKPYIQAQEEQKNKQKTKQVPKEYGLEQTLADLVNQDDQFQVGSGNHEQTESGENQDEVSSVSSIKSQDIPYYVKTISKFNLQIQDAVFIDKKNKIFAEMRLTNTTKVPIEHLSEYHHIFFRRRRHPWRIKQVYYRNKSQETQKTCFSLLK